MEVGVGNLNIELKLICMEESSMMMTPLGKAKAVIIHDNIMIIPKTEHDPNIIDRDLIPTSPLLYLIDLIPPSKAKGTVMLRARVFKSLTNTLILSN